MLPNITLLTGWCVASPQTPTTLRVAHISSATRPNKTFKHQATLPLLPIPKLEDTCANYLRLLSPLVSSKDLEDTKEIVKWFSGTEGQQLHNKLVRTHVIHLAELLLMIECCSSLSTCPVGAGRGITNLMARGILGHNVP